MKNKNFLKKLTAGILGFVMTLGVGAAGYANVASEVKGAATKVLEWNNGTYTGDATCSTNTESKTGYYQDGSGTAGTTVKYFELKKSTALWTTTPSSIKFNAKIGGGTGNKDLGHYLVVALLDSNGDQISGSATNVTNHITTAGGDSYEITMPLINNVYGLYLSHTKVASYNVRYYSFSLSYEAGSTCNHSWTTTQVVQPTCTEAGYTLETCSICDETRHTNETAALGHSYGSWTSVDDANHSKTCSRCGDIVTEAHNYDEGTVTVAPTYSSTGIMTYTCDDCNHQKTEIIPVLSADTEYKVADVVSSSGYSKYANDDAIVTYGGNNKSIGTSSSNRSNCKLSATDCQKYAVSPVTTSDIAAAFVLKKSSKNIKKITYTLNGGSNQASTSVYAIYSSDNSTFSQLTLTSGTQGATISSGYVFEFAKCTGYFGLLLKATNTSGAWRIDELTMTLTEDTESSDVETLTEISIDGNLTKTDYWVGDPISSEGLSVTAYYHVVPVEGDEYDRSEKLKDAEITLDPTIATSGLTSVNASATYEGKNASEDFAISVSEKVYVDYELVTSEDELLDGDVIVFGATREKDGVQSYFVNGPYTSTFLSSISCEIEDGVLNAFGANQITLVKTGNSWKLNLSEGLLGTQAAKAFVIDSGTDTWNISIDENNKATIASTNESYGRILYNASNPRFLNYTSNLSSDMLLPSIYRLHVNRFDVSFEDVDGTELAVAQSIKEGEKATKPSTDPSKEHFTFNYWELNGEEFDFDTAITSNLTLVANWTEDSNHTITYSYSGQTSVVEKVYDGEQIFVPENKFTAPEGYEFDYWIYTDSQEETHNLIPGTSFTMPASNITFAAHFRLIVVKYTVTYADSVSENTFTEEYGEGDTVILSTCSFTAPTGKEFDCWMNGQTRVTDNFEMPASNVTLTAAYKDIYFTVSFYNGDTKQEDQSVIYGGDLQVVACTETCAAGYEFTGWSDGEILYEPNSTIENILSDITLTSQFGATVYSITYNGVDGLENPNPTSYTIETETTKLVGIAKEGFLFKGWADNSGNIVNSIGGGMTGDLVLTAQYETDTLQHEILNQSTNITFEGQKRSADYVNWSYSNSIVSYTSFGNLTHATQTTTKTFGIRGYNKTGGGTITYSGILCNVTGYYIRSVKITFNSLTSTGEKRGVSLYTFDSAQTSIQNSMYDGTALKAPDFKFTRSTTDDIETTFDITDDVQNIGINATYNGQLIMIDSIDLGLEKIETYSVTYDTKDGTSVVDSNEYSSGDIVTLQSAPTKEHNNFVGWDVNGVVKQPGETFEISADTKVVALWTQALSEISVSTEANFKYSLDSSGKFEDVTETSLRMYISIDEDSYSNFLKAGYSFSISMRNIAKGKTSSISSEKMLITHDEINNVWVFNVALNIPSAQYETNLGISLVATKDESSFVTNEVTVNYKEAATSLYNSAEEKGLTSNQIAALKTILGIED